MKTKFLMVKFFVLRDPLQPFSYSNRRYIGTGSFGPVSAGESRAYEDEKVEPLMPLRWWDEAHTYFENKHAHATEYGEYFDRSDACLRFLPEDQRNQFNPEVLLERLRKVDPDAPYLQCTGLPFMSFSQRHALEQTEPFIYGEYAVQEAFGCPHRLRNAWIFCSQCSQSFGCPQCHEEQKAECNANLSWNDADCTIQCCRCLELQETAPECRRCGFAFSTYFCGICKEIVVLDKQTEPAFHCSKCGRCHFEMEIGKTESCAQCGQCFQRKCNSTHRCRAPDGSACPVCLGDISAQDSAIELRCGHELHWSCFSQIELQQQNASCPVCRASFASVCDQRLQQLQLARKLLKGGHLAAFSCGKCGKEQIDNGVGLCRRCWSQHATPLKAANWRTLLAEWERFREKYVTNSHRALFLGAGVCCIFFLAASLLKRFF